MVTSFSAAPTRRTRRQRGYTLALCAVLITLMSIAVALALPTWSSQIRREREEELIFRGLQMAEGIRIFQKRFGRFPVRLEELWETKPRSVRQPWKDPMTDSGRWRPITQGGVGVPGVRQGGLPGENEEGDETKDGLDEGGGEDAEEEEPGLGQPPEQGLPIIGVRSRGKGEAFKTYFGQSRIEGWRFTADQVSPNQPAAAPAGVPGAMALRIPNANWIGRPLPGVAGAMPDGTIPGLGPATDPGLGGTKPPGGKPGYQGAGVPGGVIPPDDGTEPNPDGA
jgi:type II secretory pathway pseudopilin PulG